jgi:hypothetical protein
MEERADELVAAKADSRSRDLQGRLEGLLAEIKMALSLTCALQPARSSQPMDAGPTSTIAHATGQAHSSGWLIGSSP